MQTIDDDVFEAGADRGFWIKPDGSVIPVKFSSSHWYTLEKLGLEYTQAFSAGWIRVSHTYYYDGPVSVEFSEQTTTAALQTAVALLRRGDYPDRPIAVEIVSEPSAMKTYDTPAIAASALMRRVLISSAAGRQALSVAA